MREPLNWSLVARADVKLSPSKGLARSVAIKHHDRSKLNRVQAIGAAQ
jgi:hypothetical protein